MSFESVTGRPSLRREGNLRAGRTVQSGQHGYRSPVMEESGRDAACDVAVDFMDMTDRGRLWVRLADAGPGLDLPVGRHVIVGDDDAELKVAQVISIDADGNRELQVLPGTVAANSGLLPRR